MMYPQFIIQPMAGKKNSKKTGGRHSLLSKYGMLLSFPAGIFAAGDIANGGKTVVEAVAAGKEAAAEIIGYLAKKEGVK
jgi:NADPH-dependent glutamate synthase beta subunit-like oxidoreductase